MDFLHYNNQEQTHYKTVSCSDKLKKKQLGITFAIVLAIFLIGFFVRLDYIRLSSVPDSDKEYYEDQNGLPYMYEFGDSYYHYRLTKNFLDHGYLGDTLVNGRELYGCLEY